MNKQIEMVIDVSPQGVVNAMHRDEMSLGFLGPQDIQRASEILFMPTSQQWVIAQPNAYVIEDVFVNGGEVAGIYCGNVTETHVAGILFDTYNGAREFEVAWMNECRKQGVEPFSKNSLQVATELMLRLPATS